jgi:uncharacterized protein (TIGR03437 family)
VYRNLHVDHSARMAFRRRTPVSIVTCVPRRHRKHKSEPRSAHPLAIFLATLAILTPAFSQSNIITAIAGTATVPETVTVAPAQPAIFTQNKSGMGQGLVYALRADGAQVLADAANPVSAGDTILIQCAGLGAVNPAVDAGTVTPDSPPSMTVNAVKVSIGGVDAPVTFAGLQPGLTGYQVRTTVPIGVSAGSSVPIIVSAAGQLSHGVTIAVH